MAATTDRPMLNDILVKSAQLSHDDRHRRIKQCVAAGRHDAAALPFCLEPSRQELVRYCEHCWSVIDPHGLTWSWPPQ